MVLIIQKPEDLESFANLIAKNNGNLKGAIKDYKSSLCPVCGVGLETSKHYDCCSNQCYKDKHV